MANRMFNKSIGLIAGSSISQISWRFSASTELFNILPSSSVYTQRISLTSLINSRCRCSSSWKRDVNTHSQCHGFSLRYKALAWWLRSNALFNRYTGNWNSQESRYIQERFLEFATICTLFKRFPLRLNARKRSNHPSDSSTSIELISLWSK